MDDTIVSDPVAAAAKRIDGYWYRDGINEISMGIGMLSGAGVAYMVNAEMGAGKAEWPAVAIGCTGVVLGFLDGRVKKFLRERYSYPRIGYVNERTGEPLSPRRRKLLVALMALMIVLPIAMLVVLWGRHERAASLFGWMRWGPLVIGPAMFGAALFDYERFKVRRILVEGSITAVAGIASSVFIDAPFLPYAVFVLACAILKIGFGARTLISLVRSVPAEQV